jgi:hypothetical protein
LVRLRNVYFEPLPDLADVEIEDALTDRVVAARREVSAGEVEVPNLVAGAVYKIKVQSRRHRPVGWFMRAPASGTRSADIVCPVDPDRVLSPSFPAYGELDPALRGLLEQSQLEGGSASGEALYRGLDPLQTAGLLNVFAKMRRTRLPDGSRVSDYLTRIYRVRADRFFADVDVSLRDRAKSSESAGLFREVNGKLHSPPPGFEPVDSFKTSDPFGNLQLTFFARREGPLAFKLDADIDDANGILHLFQVLRNFLTGRPTHPYDIHEILVYNQALDPGYQLRMTA